MTAKYKTEVYAHGKDHFDMSGHFLGTSLHLTDKTISKLLSERLYEYGVKRASEDGFTFVSSWYATIYTTDVENKVNDRSYHVKFSNISGGYIELTGILIRNNHPTLSHSWEIGIE